MAAEVASDCHVEVSSYGNVLAAVAFLHGLGCQELTTAERDDHDVAYSLIHAARIVKPSRSASTSR
jgi:hypothetical protein